VPSESLANVKEKERQKCTGTPLRLEVQVSGNAPDLF